MIVAHTYNSEGRIVRQFIVKDLDTLALQDLPVGETLVAGSVVDSYYLNDVLTPKTELGAIWDKQDIFADDTDIATLSGLPNPCVVIIDDDKYVVNATSIEFSTPDAGEYKVSVDHVAYFREEWTINAN